MATLRFVFRGRSNGGTRVEGVGFQGGECEKAKDGMLQAMGAKTTGEQRKAEFYDSNKADRLLEDE